MGPERHLQEVSCLLALRNIEANAAEERGDLQRKIVNNRLFITSFGI
jgi:hypothetical protein